MDPSNPLGHRGILSANHADIRGTRPFNSGHPDLPLQQEVRQHWSMAAVRHGGLLISSKGLLLASIGQPMHAESHCIITAASKPALILVCCRQH